ncbi:MAG: hypothetical protein JW874_14650 [Spirochaetales bacterium]|nr:hypothetical protein [Spirochaetales bacterium]
MFENLQILEILKLGLIGLGFLLCLFSFLLINTEQKRENGARKKVLKSIYVFMGVTILFFAGNLLLELIKIQREHVYEQTWTIKGTFDLDYDEGGSEIKYFTIPSSDITTFYSADGRTGYCISNFKPNVMNGKIVFPDLGFQSEKYSSMGNIQFSPEDVGNNPIVVHKPVQFREKPETGGQP